MKHTLQFDKKAGTTILMTDGRPRTCPYKQPILIPGQIQGNVSMIHLPCSTDCALMDYDGSSILLNCSQSANRIPVELEGKNDKPTIKLLP
jgi:hypothetical protein